mmetsp:Transcript_33310/g.80575  ORF Transcript_33310/g.80575 Transcript_33310/m.80575 type:complete len:208 (+) Transcript_33310:1205-1828(+)
MAAKEGSSPTVKFNVGGKIYEVSKSLLQRFPDTILAKKASTEESSPIFLDRDPDRFAYCLDFMRDNGEVHLPETVTKAALLGELKFFGFAYFKEDQIDDQQSKRQAAIRIQDIIAASRKRIADRERELKERIGMEKLALHCFMKSLETTYSTVSVAVDWKAGPFQGVYIADAYLREYCNNFGLELTECSDKSSYSNTIIINLKKQCT